MTERWGVSVTTVEIREIVPPREIQAAMNRQMSAERTRRAAVTESEGQQQADILVAEGQKLADILRAEGDRAAARLRAEGYAVALNNVFDVAQGVDTKTMSLQYLDTLRNIGSGPATKWIIPTEFAELLGPLIRGHTASLPNDGEQRESPPAGPAGNRTQ